MSDGKLEKLTIFTFTDEKCESKGDPEKFVAMFNPTSYTEKYEMEYKQDPAPGTSKSAPKFGYIKPKDYTFEFIIDGTGVTEDLPTDANKKKDFVNDKIKEFLKATVDYVGDSHRPHFLKIAWGRLTTTVVIKSADITYSLFDRNGNPVRAKIAASFTENIEDSLRVKKENASSPDLTHFRKVKEESKLPLMVYKEFGSHLHYLSVARANKLNNFRSLTVGTTLALPPLKNETEQQ